MHTQYSLNMLLHIAPKNVGQKPLKTEAPGSKNVKVDKSPLMKYTTRTKHG